MLNKIFINHFFIGLAIVIDLTDDLIIGFKVGGDDSLLLVVFWLPTKPGSTVALLNYLLTIFTSVFYYFKELIKGINIFLLLSIYLSGDSSSFF